MELLTVEELSGKLKLSPKWIRQHQEEIGYYKLGGAVRFRPEEVSAWLESKHIIKNRNGEPQRVVRRFKSRHFG